MLPGSLGTLRNELAGIVSTGADETQDTAAGEVVATDTTAESGLASGSELDFDLLHSISTVGFITVCFLMNPLFPSVMADT